MNEALYNALYIEFTTFQWVHFTPHGVVAGARSDLRPRWTWNYTTV